MVAAVLEACYRFSCMWLKKMSAYLIVSNINYISSTEKACPMCHERMHGNCTEISLIGHFMQILSIAKNASSI
jgi:hypothetical protein